MKFLVAPGTSSHCSRVKISGQHLGFPSLHWRRRLPPSVTCSYCYSNSRGTVVRENVIWEHPASPSLPYLHAGKRPEHPAVGGVHFFPAPADGILTQDLPITATETLGEPRVSASESRSHPSNEGLLLAPRVVSMGWKWCLIPCFGETRPVFTTCQRRESRC